jgi:HEAT repeat protein
MLANDDDSGVRASAATALGKVGAATNNVVPALIKALDDKDQHTRNAAVGALGTIGSDARDAVPALLRLLATEGNYKSERERMFSSRASAAGALDGSVLSRRK